MAEKGLDLSDVGTAFAQPGGVGMAEPIGAEAGEPGVVADGQHNLDDPGDGQGSALAGPQRTGLAPRMSSQAEIRARAVGGIGTVRTWSPLPCR